MKETERDITNCLKAMAAEQLKESIEADGTRQGLEGPAIRAMLLHMADTRVRRFAKAILHGSEEHRAWLLEAAECFMNDKPMPPPRA